MNDADFEDDSRRYIATTMGYKQKHWAEDLTIADRCLATIRHATNGDLNRIDVPVIVADNRIKQQVIQAYDAQTDKLVYIPYNELKKI